MFERLFKMMELGNMPQLVVKSIILANVSPKSSYRLLIKQQWLPGPRSWLYKLRVTLYLQCLPYKREQTLKWETKQGTGCFNFTVSDLPLILDRVYIFHEITPTYILRLFEDARSLESDFIFIESALSVPEIWKINENFD